MRAISQNIPFTFVKASLTIFFLLFLFSGCSHLGLVENSAPSPHRDIERSYFPNGNLEYEAEFINEKLDGTSRVWTEDGTLLSISKYSNGQPNGVWKIFHPNGSLMHAVQYEYGKKHGYETWYFENGQLKSEQKFKYGEVETEIIRWHSDGTILY